VFISTRNLKTFLGLPLHICYHGCTCQLLLLKKLDDDDDDDDDDAHIILVPDATFVINLMYLGLLSHEISFGEKTATQPDIPPRHSPIQLISPTVNPSEE